MHTRCYHNENVSFIISWSYCEGSICFTNTILGNLFAVLCIFFLNSKHLRCIYLKTIDVLIKDININIHSFFLYKQGKKTLASFMLIFFIVLFYCSHSFIPGWFPPFEFPLQKNQNWVPPPLPTKKLKNTLPIWNTHTWVYIRFTQRLADQQRRCQRKMVLVTLILIN